MNETGGARGKLLDKFRDITLDRLRILNQGLLDIEKGSRDENLINQLMREIHTLKGESRMMGFSDVNLITHKIEDLLKSLQLREFRFQPQETDILFEALDAVGRLVQKKLGEGKKSVDLLNLTNKLTAAADGKNLEPQAPGSAPETPGAKPSSLLLSQAEESIRVGIEKLDQLSNVSGDIFINQIRNHNLVSSLRNLKNLFRECLESASGTVSVDEFKKLQKELNQISKEFQDETMKMDYAVSVLQDQVREVRLLPISTLFDLFPRMVRDLAKEFGKEIELETQGGTAELDKIMLDRIKDPLIHLIRNSIDHGVEPPEERIRAGKPRTGKILLSASTEGDHIIIEIEDNGQGINPEGIIASAVKKRFLTPAQAEAGALNQRDIFALLFTPGFSTKDVITDLSGRGVGLDVVKQNIEAMEGSVEIQSEIGKGTKFTLRLPPRLNIIKVLLLSLRESLFAIPSSAAVEVLKVLPSDTLSVEGQKVIRFRGATIPIFHLDDILYPNAQARPNGKTKWPVVIIESAREKLALVADRIISEREIAVKPLGKFLGEVRNLAGATLLEKGELALFLHVPDLFESVHARQRVSPAAEETETAARAGRILVVEDSLITREMEKSVLLSYGYEVQEAEDGLQALTRLGEEAFDLVITDVEMPNLNGFDLTEKIRADARTRSLPVIIVTTRSSPEDRRRGVEVGADAYIVKSEFQHEKLVEIIQRLIQ
ncbi:MAG: hybrid sensor histidine kinase/response regulator [bacterium]|nr:hybrid sensor histidine kinase/response regulator [bacterium]